MARISPGEQAGLNAAADLLATTTRRARPRTASSSSTPAAPFTGHAVCDDVEWINGMSWPIGESYHPNRAESRATPDCVEAALRRLTAMPPPGR